MRYCNDCGRCYHGRTRPTEAACECGNGCACSCPCAANVARQEREDVAYEAYQRAAYARKRSGVVRIARLRAVNHPPAENV